MAPWKGDKGSIHPFFRASNLVRRVCRSTIQVEACTSIDYSHGASQVGGGFEDQHTDVEQPLESVVKKRAKQLQRRSTKKEEDNE